MGDWREAGLDQEAGQADLCWRAGLVLPPSKKSEVIRYTHSLPSTYPFSIPPNLGRGLCLTQLSQRSFAIMMSVRSMGRHSHSKPINPETDGSGGLPAVTIGGKFTASAQPPLFTHDNEEHTLRE